MAVTLRRTKGLALTFDELDDNFLEIDNISTGLQAINQDGLFFKQPSTVISENYTVPEGENWMSIGPLQIANNVTVTVEGDWVVV